MSKYFLSEEFKKRLYEVVEASKKNDLVSKAYDFMILVTVIVGLLPLCMKTENIYAQAIDVTVAVIFLFDYFIRVYTSDYKMGIKCYQAYVAYAFSPMAIIDLLSILPIMVIFFSSQHLVTLFKFFRIFRIFMILKLIRYSKTMVTISNVLRKVKRQLMAVLLLTLTYLAASAMLVFQLEPDIFGTFFDALYWATISITTIGYGDISPATTVGRLITMISSLVGVALIALPSGIITAAYMDEIKKKKGKHEL